MKWAIGPEEGGGAPYISFKYMSFTLPVRVKDIYKHNMFSYSGVEWAFKKPFLMNFPYL